MSGFIVKWLSGLDVGQQSMLQVSKASLTHRGHIEVLGLPCGIHSLAPTQSLQTQVNPDVLRAPAVVCRVGVCVCMCV